MKIKPRCILRILFITALAKSMFRKFFPGVFISFVLLNLVAGSTVLMAQDDLEESRKQEMERAISIYQEGDQGGVIRFLMQRGYEGNVAAQFNLGVINFLRDDKNIGATETQFWFEEAAEEGDLIAQMNLGVLEVNAGLVGQDRERLDKGEKWLRRAAESGFRPAQVNLGGLLAIEILEASQPGEGRSWLELASSGGDSRAKQILQGLSDSAKAEEIFTLLYPVDAELRSEPSIGGSKVIVNNAAVYPEPTVQQKAITKVKKGALVEVIDRSGNWANVKIPAGLPVWVAKNLVEIENDLVRVDRLEATLFSAPSNSAGAVDLGTVTKGETFKLIEDMGDWLLVRSPSRIAGWMQKSDVASRIKLIDQPDEPLVSANNEVNILTPGTVVIGTLINDAEILRTSDQNGQLLGVVVRNTEVKVEDRVGGYLRAEGVQVTGWVSKRLVVLGERSETSQLVAKVNTDVLRVRSRPNIESVSFAQLRRNQEVVVTAQQDSWVRVSLGKQSGWIASQLIKIGKEQARISNAAATPPKAENQRVLVKADSILYSGDSTASKPLGRTSQPASFSGSQQAAMIRVSDPVIVYGWVHETLVKQDDDQGEITSDSVRIRLDPTTTLANIIGSRNRGVRLPILGRQDRWLKVALASASGWVTRNAIQQVDSN